jgi:hypothetical protein
VLPMVMTRETWSATVSQRKPATAFLARDKGARASVW